MAKSFSLNSPQHQLADELRRRIDSGELSGNLPGLRRLMADFAATRTVVEGAIAQLIKTGDLKSRGPNKAMELVRRRGTGKADGGTLIVFDQPVELRSANSRETFIALETALAAPVTRLRLDSHDAPIGETVRRVLESDHTRIIVMDHPGEVADRLAEAGRIVVAMGTANPATKVSQVSVGHEPLVRGAIRRAFESGHRRVSFILWRRKPAVAEKMRTWIADEYTKSGYKHVPEFDAPVVTGRTPEALHACLRELLRLTPPTALIVSDFAQWLGTVMVLAQAGLRVPGDVSLISLCSAKEWATATPTQAHFRHPVTALAKTVRRALDMTARGKPPEQILLEPEWIPGKSLGPPAK